MTWTARIARRPLLASIAGVFGVAIAGGAVYEGTRLFGRRYPRTKFDDLLDQLPDRESAAKLGHAAMAQAQKHSMEPGLPMDAAADEIRKGPARGSLAKAVESDIARGRLADIQGWLLPVSLIEMAIIAAGVEQPA